MKKVIALLLIAVMALSMVACGNGGKEKSYTFTTGGSQGTYFGFTNTVAGILADKIDGMKFTAVTSGGSKANIEALADGDNDLAIVQNDVMINAYNGKADFEGHAVTSFSVIGAVYPEVCQIIASKDSGINSVADMRDKKISIGAAGSGVVTNAKQILAKAGLTLDDIKVQYLDSGASASALKEGKLDAFFFTGGVPTPAMVDLMTSNDVVVVSLSDAEVAALKAESSFYVEVEMTHATYDDIPEGTVVKAVAVTATYIVTNDMPEDDVYAITKALWDNQAQIAEAHNTGKSMNIANALKGMDNVPVNAGARRYYQEALDKYNADNGTSLTFNAFYGLE